MNYKLAYRLYNISCVIALGFILSMLIFEVSYYLFGALALGTFLIGATISFLFYKCPHCNSGLSTRVSRTPICPYCGEKID